MLDIFGAKRLAARWQSTINVSLGRAGADPAAENNVLESEQCASRLPEVERR